VTEEVWSWWQIGSVHRAPWPVESEIRVAVPDPTLDGAAWRAARDITAHIRRERSGAGCGFSQPVLVYTLPRELESVWLAISDDVLTGNNAVTVATSMQYGDDFEIRVAGPAAHG
jgi:valyl-tRNA synthetase